MVENFVLNITGQLFQFCFNTEPYNNTHKETVSNVDWPCQGQYLS